SQEYPSFTGLVQFRNQYEITKHLPIPGIARPLSLESCGNGYALVMEDRGGTDLRRYVQQNPLDLAEILDIAVHLASILHGLHQHRIIHKDIKPANILIQPELKQVELIDFSIASLLPKESQEIQSPSTLEGTLVYMAPEQTGRMNRAVDYRSDFYALGVTLYELLTGQLPFASDDPLTLIHCHMAQIAAAVDQVNPAVPTVLAAIVAKLMAKNAEERYQSALGLKHDLEQCLQQWQVQGNIADFELGQRDVCDRFLIPEKLYGREAEVQTLLDAFERVAQGSSELMLVAGFSGIGKTAVVNEVHKPITRQKGYFIKGKFDQFNRNIPFSAFVQAFRSLMQQLLSESDSALSVWKQGILEAVGSNGQVLIDVIPELKRIIGTQPTVSELSGSAAQERFNLLFSKFVKVFTTFEHPLVIFLDDLQWADSASLNLLKLLMSKSALGYLLVLGAYRDNEVPAGHSLMLTLDDIARQGAILNTLTLTPLRQPNITQLVADALFCSPELAKPLSKIVHQKTQGNPFFTTQFLQGLQAEGCITFDINAGHWECDLAQVRQLAMTDNVVEFMVRRLQKLPSAVQRVMKLAACVGNRFDLPTLALVCEGSQEKAAADLWCALQAGLIIPENETYKFFQGHQEVSGQASNVVVEYRFLHDRVQQAAYNLIPASERPNIHLKLAEIFEAKASDSASKEIIFEIINHYNQSPLHELSSKRFWDLVNLNIQAAKTAKSATAFEAANTYLTQALTLIDGLDPQPWEHQYTLILDLYIALIKVKNACLLWNESKEASQLLYKNSRSQIDKSISLQLLIEQSTQRGEFALAIEYGQEALTLLGEKLPNTDLAPALQDLIATVQQQSEAIALLQCGQFRSLEDKRLKQVVAILSSLDAPAYLAFPELWKVINALSVKITLLHGITSESAAGFARFGQILCGQLDGSYAQGFAFSQLALKLSNLYPEQKGLVCFEIGLATNHWSSPLRENIDYFQTGFQAAMECGIVLYAGYNLMFQPYYRHYLGQEISEILTLTQQYADFAKQTKNALADILIAGFLPHLERLNATLDAKEWHDWSDSFIEQVTEQQNPLALAMHIITVGQLNFLLGDLNSAEAAFSKASNLKSTLLGYFSLAEYSFYRALLGLQSTSAGSADLSDTADLIHTCVDDLEQWANQNPDNFAHKYKLVSAEQHRVSGDRLTALDLYDCAIATARSNQYLQDEALANELAAKFYLDWGKEKVAAGYMQEAYYCYSRWGAKAKVMDLEARYPELLRPILQPVAPSEEVMSTLMSIAAPTVSAHSSTHHSSSTMGLNQTLDFASVLKASQVLSSVIEFDELLSQLTQIILQNSGGDRCALALLDEAGHWQVRAMATPDGT
ncbi:MAG: serine/threonine-protein kinase PknK, partial [Cyanobacteria bacterium P01_D01_bin.128]